MIVADFEAFLWVFFNKTIIPLALVGYEIVIANLVLTISYPTSASGIIVKYSKCVAFQIPQQKIEVFS